MDKSKIIKIGIIGIGILFMIDLLKKSSYASEIIQTQTQENLLPALKNDLANTPVNNNAGPRNNPANLPEEILNQLDIQRQLSEEVAASNIGE